MKQALQDGGRAFPVTGGCGGDRGMTLRDWFAGMAISGILSDPNVTSPRDAVETAFAVADMMIKTRTSDE